jgi:hypothetical protein
MFLARHQQSHMPEAVKIGNMGWLCNRWGKVEDKRQKGNLPLGKLLLRIKVR